MIFIQWQERRKTKQHAQLSPTKQLNLTQPKWFQSTLVKQKRLSSIVLHKAGDADVQLQLESSTSLNLTIQNCFRKVNRWPGGPLTLLMTGQELWSSSGQFPALPGFLNNAWCHKRSVSRGRKVCRGEHANPDPLDLEVLIIRNKLMRSAPIT